MGKLLDAIEQCPIASHKFEPRYDMKFPPGLQFNGTANVEAIEVLKEKIYIKDICIKCGKTIERK